MAERGDLLKTVPSDDCFKTLGDLEVTRSEVKSIPHVKICAFFRAPGEGHEQKCAHDIAQFLSRGGSCEYSTVKQK